MADFSRLEGSKENMQPLKQGRTTKGLVNRYDGVKPSALKNSYEETKRFGGGKSPSCE
jgi:hypothetical protein